MNEPIQQGIQLRQYNNAICSLNNVGLDPYYDKRTITVLQRWITDYSRRAYTPIGYSYNNAFISIDNNIPSLQNKTSVEIENYMKLNWFDFFSYGVGNVYPNKINVSYSRPVYVEPQWNSIEDAKKSLGVSNWNLLAVSPYGG